MSILNSGNSEIFFDYKHDAKGDSFNGIITDLIKPGIYSGGELTYSGNNLIIAPFVAYIKYSASKGIRVKTTTNITLAVTEAQPIARMSFSWSNTIENWPDYSSCAVGSTGTYDVVFGHATFSGGNINGVDYTYRTYGLINSSGELTVSTINESTPDAGVTIDGASVKDGKINLLSLGCGAGDISTNIAIGIDSLYSNTTGANNTAIGYNALYNNTSGDNNVAIGYDALGYNTTGVRNTAIGYNALYNNTSGDNNVAIGYNALGDNTIGYNNVAIGYEALQTNTTGVRNTAVGWGTLDINTTGANNTAIGYAALYNNITGANNTVIGYSALDNNTSGDNNVAIGYEARSASSTASNSVTLGNSNITSLRCAVTTITALSDERDKTNIQGLAIGLDFIMKLKPKTFQWKKRDWKDGRTDPELQIGLIAQDVIKIEEELGIANLKFVNRDVPEKYELSVGKVLLPLVLAVQELKSKIDNLENEICVK